MLSRCYVTRVVVMTEEQVATAIAVLRAYADGTLRTDQCDALDEALIKAYQAWELATCDVDQYSEDVYSNYGYSSPQEDE
jgi:hypothetical protein